MWLITCMTFCECTEVFNVCICVCVCDRVSSSSFVILPFFSPSFVRSSGRCFPMSLLPINLAMTAATIGFKFDNGVYCSA